MRNAEPLLDVRDKTPAQIEFLVLAVATGYLAQHDFNNARAVLNDAIPALAPGRKDLPWFVDLRRATGASVAGGRNIEPRIGVDPPGRRPPNGQLARRR